MKVFFPVEVFYPSQAGGPANSVYWLTKELVNEGFEPVIVASDKGLANGHPKNRWVENEAGRVIHVKTRWLNFPIGQTLRSLANLGSTNPLVSGRLEIGAYLDPVNGGQSLDGFELHHDAFGDE